MALQVRFFFALFCWLARVDAKPNIIIWMPDDMRYLSQWPNPPWRTRNPAAVNTPNIDSVLNEGATFTRAYSGGVMCAPSRFNVLTGRYCSRSVYARSRLGTTGDMTMVTVPNCKLSGSDLAQNLQTELSNDGYATAAIGKWHLKAGRVDWADYPGTQASVRSSGFTAAEGIYIDNIMDATLNFTHNLEWMVEHGLSFMETSVAANQPFFLYFTPTVPHSSQSVMAALNSTSTTTPEGTLPAEISIPGMATRSDIMDAAQLVQGTNTASRLDDAAGALWLDAALGVFIAKLRALNVYNNTVLVLLHDHGQDAKSTPYEGGARILHAVRYPPLFASSTIVDSVVSNVDLVPSLLDIAGINPSYVPDGVSWAGDPSAGTQTRFVECNQARAVVTKDAKYITKSVASDFTSSTYPNAADLEQFYDLNKNGGDEQTNDVASATYANDVATLAAALKCHTDATVIGRAAREGAADASRAGSQSALACY